MSLIKIFIESRGVSKKKNHEGLGAVVSGYAMMLLFVAFLAMIGTVVMSGFLHFLRRIVFFLSMAFGLRFQLLTSFARPDFQR